MIGQVPGLDPGCEAGDGFRRRPGARALAVALTVAAVAMASTSAAASWREVLAQIDPGRDPAVAYFATESRRSAPAWRDDIRWSVDAAIENDWLGEPSATAAGRLTLPILSSAIAAERAERARVERELAAHEHDALRRETIYGVLDLMCRWGYLAAVEPLLQRLAELPGEEHRGWTVRGTNAARERRALERQLELYAPSWTSRAEPRTGFACRFPPSPLYPPIDGLDGHPSLRRLVLEARRNAHQMAFSYGMGPPELILEGSMRYGFTTRSMEGDIRVSAHIPFRLGSAHAAVDADVDTWRGRVGVSVHSGGPSPSALAGADVTAQLAAERAALQYRIASAVATLELVRVEERSLADAVGPAFAVLADEACTGLCPIRHLDPLHVHDLPIVLDRLGLAYEVARSGIELMRVLEIDPTSLADGRQ